MAVSKVEDEVGDSQAAALGERGNQAAVFEHQHENSFFRLGFFRFPAGTHPAQGLPQKISCRGRPARAFGARNFLDGTCARGAVGIE